MRSLDTRMVHFSKKLEFRGQPWEWLQAGPPSRAQIGVLLMLFAQTAEMDLGDNAGGASSSGFLPTPVSAPPYWGSELKRRPEFPRVFQHMKIICHVKKRPLFIQFVGPISATAEGAREP